MSDDEICSIAKKQLQFLETVHPFITERRSYIPEILELRPIFRGEKTGKSTYIQSYTTWANSEKSLDLLVRFLEKINGRPYCLYYSVFCFIPTLGDGRYRINNKNAECTNILVADFDEISEEEFYSRKKKFSQLGLKTLDVFSGHGYQSILLLQEKTEDKNILKKYTNTLLRKGFHVDPAIVDPARIMRMPFSYNCKSCDPRSKYFSASPEIFETSVVNQTTERYDVDDVFARLETLPDVEGSIEPESEKIISNNKPRSRKKMSDEELCQMLENDYGKKLENTEIQYAHLLDVDSLPEPVLKMLMGIPEGQRNKVMMFLVPYFRNSLGLSLPKIKEVMHIWGKNCHPSLDADFVSSEVDRIYGYGFKGKHGAYTKELHFIYGHMPLNKYKKDSKIIISNEFFDEKYRDISPGSIRIFLALKLAEKEGYKHFSRDDMRKAVGISERTLDRNIRNILRSGYLCKRKKGCVKQKGEKYTYYLNPYFSSVSGFTSVETATVKLMLEELSNGETKLYLYLSRMTDRGRECWASQKYLAQKVGKTQCTISKMTDSLCQKKFIEKNTFRIDDIAHCEYVLKY